MCFHCHGEEETHQGGLDVRLVRLNLLQMKRMHKLMVMSHTYRQQSQRTEELNQQDPDNRLYGRANLRRLDAETTRDSILIVSENLNLKLGGPSVPVAEDGEGQATLGRRILNEGLCAGIEDIGAEKYRRSIYLQSKRGLPLSLLSPTLASLVIVRTGGDCGSDAAQGGRTLGGRWARSHGQARAGETRWQGVSADGRGSTMAVCPATTIRC
jgi:hypothetical protein